LSINPKYPNHSGFIALLQQNIIAGSIEVISSLTISGRLRQCVGEPLFDQCEIRYPLPLPASILFLEDGFSVNSSLLY